MPIMDLANIQGNTLQGYHFALSSYLFFKVDDPDQARDWLSAITPHVTTSQRWPDSMSKPKSAVNIAFSFAGLKALRLPPSVLGTFSLEFQQGMSQRADLLGDTPESHPDRWWDQRCSSGDIHILVAINALNTANLNERRLWLHERLHFHGGLKPVYSLDAARLPQDREHFGFVDGLSQPSIAGGPSPASPGQGTPQDDGSWRPLQPGEFIFGYPDEEGLLPDAPRPTELGRNGTYLVFRKLHQNVAAFRKFIRERARNLQDQELLAAKLMGRYRDGTPLAKAANRENERNKKLTNDFRYADDPQGLRCPVGAHIRRSNPRDDGLGRITNRHRIIRRGITYGPPLPDGVEEDDGKERGMLFMAINSNIARQFEFIQSEWINDGNLFGIGRDKDPVVGDHNGNGKMTIAGCPPRFITNIPRFVRVCAGEYFFLPGVNGLHWIVGTRPEIAS